MLPIIERTQIAFLCVMLCTSLLSAQPAQNPQTFCNPLNLNYRFMGDAVDAREAADPVIILFKDDYYLFASRSGGYWTSTDLRNWTLIIPTVVDIETYAPAVVVMRDTVFYSPSASGRIYKSADPKSGVWMSGPSFGTYGDPDLFLDDDGKLYMYFGLTNTTTIANIRVVELNPMTFQEIGSPVDIIFSSAKTHGWERRGDDNLLDEVPWIEGSWMTKINNKYYLQYAAPGTEFKTYGDGVYVADSPKGPFQYAPYSPFSFKPTGFISGAGHSGTFKDKDGHYWHISTMTISVKAMFERRLGLWPVAVDADGNIRCNTDFGDYPQYFPGIKANPITENFAGMMLLSHKKFATASSSLKGYEIQKAVDEDVRTYWSAQSGDAGEWMLVDLGKECSIEAIQVNFAEHNTNPAIVRGRSNPLFEQYTIETSNDASTWNMLIDKSQNTRDVPHDYVELAQPHSARYVKLTNMFTPGGGNFAVRDLRVFGNSTQGTFTPATNIAVQRDPNDERNAVIRWSPVANADGYIVHYGIAPNKLYNNYMVYDTDSIAIHSLNKGVEYYFDVQAFDGGTEYYRSTGEFRSSQSGNWNDVASWQRNDGIAWNPASVVPKLTDGPITILNGHTITMTAADSADQLVVADSGFFVIGAGVSFKVKDGIGVDLMVSGIVRNSGSITGDALANISFGDGGKYVHEQNGGSIPAAAWKPGSTCEIAGVTDNVPSNATQEFYNFTWNCPNQSTNLNVGWHNGTKIAGTLTVTNSNWNHASTSSPAYQFRLFGGAGSCSINNIVVNGYNAVLTPQGSSYADTVIVNGNITLSNGGMLSLSNNSGGVTAYSVKGDFTVLDSAYIGKSNSANASKFIFNGSDAQNLNLPSTGAIFFGAPNITVDSGAILNMGTSVFSGTGSFQLLPYATLQTAHVDGINGNITCTGANGGGNSLSNEAGYGFNGSAAQATGNLMPPDVYDLIINNSAGVTLSNTVLVDGTFEMVKGALSIGSNSVRYTSNGSLKYSGSVAQTTSDAEFPLSDGPKNLVIANTRGVTLHDSRAIAGNLDLSGRLTLGANTLMANSASNTGTTAYVVTSGAGALKLTSVGQLQKLFPVGTGSAYSPVWITNSGVVDTISVKVASDATAVAGGRVRVKWNISEATEGGSDYTLQFGWMGSLEDTKFRNDRAGNARIFRLSDTTEAGTGSYTTQFVTQPYSVSRAGITVLDSFAVGMLKGVTGVAEQKNGVPSEFSLSQNYPNPFNPTTVISYQLPVTSNISLRVYNLLGQEVATLFEGIRQPGNYEATFSAEGGSASGGDGSKLASGVYLYRLSANYNGGSNFVETKKLILLK